MGGRRCRTSGTVVGTPYINFLPPNSFLRVDPVDHPPHYSCPTNHTSQPNSGIPMGRVWLVWIVGALGAQESSEVGFARA